MQNTLVTPRLTLRPVCIEDAEAMFSRMSDAQTTRYLYNPPDKTIDDTRAYIEKAAAEWKKDAPVYLSFSILLDAVAIGEIFISVEDDAQADIGWVFGRRYCGRGFATEAAEAALLFCRNKLHLRRITARCDARNTASARLMERLSMTLIDDSGTRYYARFGEHAAELTFEKIL